MAFLAPILVALLVLMFASLRIVQEYERGIVYTFGQYTGTRTAGPRFILPAIQKMLIVDIRIRTEDVPPQDIISRDNVSVKVSAVVYYRVVDPSFAINRVENFAQATSQLAQTTLRSVLGKHDLDDMLGKRDQMSKDVQEILDAQTEGWGIKITDVAIKDIDLDPTMIRAIARQAEAERERRAKVINAEGEFQAARQLDEAAKILANRPETMQLRYLATMNEFTNTKGSVIVLPLPLDLLRAGLQGIGRKDAA